MLCLCYECDDGEPCDAVAIARFDGVPLCADCLNYWIEELEPGADVKLVRLASTE